MDETTHSARPFWKSRSAIALLVFAAVASFLLFSEHRAHFLGVPPYSFAAFVPADASFHASRPWSRPRPWHFSE
ncbi:MAG: hypothetical protein PPHEINF_3322 [uncultured Paraburkholderia sp.]|nr:MAG: hypothetical protein PPHEINF_3322 [uncultured Paraburkholderia sp.]CAH2793529.1 MAG: hypothetical protein PPHEESC_3483 [uncultured Paraburkholderia sp.]CAH2928019.1 MAG: hypothetical protein PPHEMADMSA_3355 [uncultured Paraburkholderia sp.]CAH2929760.1 MAG: hypothetical protein PPHERAN_3425 [uncultured Paraburkholderia sp.]